MCTSRLPSRRFRPSRRALRIQALSIALLAAAAFAVAAEAPAAKSADATSRLGIGFLWTAQSERVAAQLSTDGDFVDVILGPGKLDAFKRVPPPVRVACIARSLEKNSSRPFPGLKETIELLREARIEPERVILAYNPEGQPGTPTGELRELVSSTRRAKAMADAYGAPLLVGPGLREMQRREELYPELAKSCDIWLIQSQRLQLDEASRKPVSVEAYRAGVKRIVDRLREGNPRIQIYVQLVTVSGRDRRDLSAAEVAEFARSIEDLVDAVRIYGAPEERLRAIIAELRGPTGHSKS